MPNALGSTIALADTTGTVQTSYTYEPFGNTTSAGAVSTNSFQYTGRENDGTGLYYYRARYYSPRLQRFTNEDPIGYFGGGSNFYTYVLNKSTIVRDPLGLLPGDTFKTELEAVFDAIDYSLQQRNQRIEYGGFVYSVFYNNSRKYVYTFKKGDPGSVDLPPLLTERKS